ncbi:LOW QUALITY PROTEIN: hypothetical protein V2J09_006450 [Rumex salicifolius]
MSIILWNVRGAGKPSFASSLKYLMRAHKVDFVAIFETQVSGSRARHICSSLNLGASHVVDSVGRAGGIFISWNPSVFSIGVVASTPRYVLTKFSVGGVNCHFLFAYAPPSVHSRTRFWREVESALTLVSGPVFFGGDLNCITQVEERIGGSGILHPDSGILRDLLDRLGLIDMGFSGSPFTWSRGSGFSSYVAKRLDRVVMNMDAFLAWPYGSVRHLPSLCSDHSALLFSFKRIFRVDRRRRPFRFEEAWTRHPDFLSFVRGAWNSSCSASSALASLKVSISWWNSHVFGNVAKRKVSLLRRIDSLQASFSSIPSDANLEALSALTAELELTLDQEEALWKQKSKELWLSDGDRNTTFFHASTVLRRSNRVMALINSDEEWVNDKEELQSLVKGFFESLYSLPRDELFPIVTPHNRFPTLDVWGRLDAPFEDHEIVAVIRGMRPLKSPGPDGFSPVFYQKSWSVVGPSVIAAVRSFLLSISLPQGLNATFLSLIPKVSCPDRVAKFRPIGLCNVLYKIITKMLSNRMKEVLPLLISPVQGSFLPGRLITDNIALAQDEALRDELHRECGIPVTADLGFYLGIPLLNKAMNVGTFEPLIQSMHARLSGWKGKLLSMSGRVTLARSVLNAILVYTMASFALPRSICDRLDRVTQNFIWGSFGDERRMHLLPWEEICKPRSLGGLGLKRMKEFNLAMIGKLAWRFANSGSEPWADLI